MSPTNNPLAGTKLIYFRATPTQLRPFERSKLEWSAVLPDGVLLSLSGADVPSDGTLEVEPYTTQTYVLTAHAGSARSPLGEVVVNVDTRGCSTHATPAYVKLVEGSFLDKLSDPTRDPPLQFISDANKPNAALKDGLTEITFAVRALTGRALGLGDPEIDVDVTFYWAAANDADDDIVPVFTSTHIDVSFPPIIRLVPGLNLDQRAEKARQDMWQGIVGGLFELGNKVFWPKNARPARTHVTTVQVKPDESGTITIGYCPALSPRPPVGPPVAISAG
ncbi:MAG TPA: hypothetical protein VJ891_07105 [Casimicrobiaceae bacterium]|nr:hypothetical protein [Casimicrobiaceae bacterium]